MADFVTIPLRGDYYTGFDGINKLNSFYYQCSTLYSCNVYLDFYNLKWFDANLSAILGALIFKLSHENQLSFSTDYEYIKQKFDILFRNGFINETSHWYDDRFTTIPFRSFYPNHIEQFVTYIEDLIFSHRRMTFLNAKDTDILLDSLVEISSNIEAHAKSQYAFYTCGQYYPKKRQLRLTILDLGCGFLPAIQNKTQNKINSSIDAIKWALEERRTSRVGIPGGLGLFNLRGFMESNGGDLQITSGDAFWSLAIERENWPPNFFSSNFDNPFNGTIINLIFNT